MPHPTVQVIIPLNHQHNQSLYLMKCNPTQSENIQYPIRKINVSIGNGHYNK